MWKIYLFPIRSKVFTSWPLVIRIRCWLFSENPRHPWSSKVKIPEKTNLIYSSDTDFNFSLCTFCRRCLNVLLSHKMPANVASRTLYKITTQEKTILMNKLLNRGADIEYQNEATGFTALLLAMKRKCHRATQFLLEKGASPAAHDSSG